MVDDVCPSGKPRVHRSGLISGLLASRASPGYCTGGRWYRHSKHKIAASLTPERRAFSSTTSRRCCRTRGVQARRRRARSAHANALTSLVVAVSRAAGSSWASPSRDRLGAGVRAGCAKMEATVGHRAERPHDLVGRTTASEMHRDAIDPGQRVSSSWTICSPPRPRASDGRSRDEIGGSVAGVAFLIELTDLKGVRGLRARTCARGSPPA